MFDYRTRPVRVEAFEWRPECLKRLEYWYARPHWFDGATDALVGNKRLFGKIKIVGENLQVNTETGGAVAHPGDWVVCWLSKQDTPFTVHTPEEFDRLFDKDERRTRMRSTNEKPRSAKPTKNIGRVS